MSGPHKETAQENEAFSGKEAVDENEDTARPNLRTRQRGD